VFAQIFYCGAFSLTVELFAVQIKPTGRFNFFRRSFMEYKLSSRDKLLESAATLFLEKGYDATSVNDICKHAGVSKGSF
jgi:hypothetical protein